MNSALEKLTRAKELILEVEEDFIREKRSCPYEVGYTLRNLEEAIEKVRNISI